MISICQRRLTRCLIFPVAVLSILQLLPVNAFVAPRATCHRAMFHSCSTPKCTRPFLCNALPPMTLAEHHPGSIDSIMTSFTTAAEDAGLDNAFTDELDLFGDPTIRIMFGVFGVVIVLLLAANALFGQMDSAIEKVLVDFEKAMRENYPSQWRDIAEELEGLDDTERPVKLMQIMEKMQKDKPEFMSRVNSKIATRN